jgi:hypothetical protein
MGGAVLGATAIGAAGALTGATPAAADASTGVFDVQDYGAVGDGVADDGPSIRAAIAAIPSGGGVLYFAPGQYRVLPYADSTYQTYIGFKLKDNVWMRGCGSASTLLAQGNLVLCMIDGLQNVTVSDVAMVIDLNNDAGNNFTIERCSIRATNVPDAYLTLHAVLAHSVRGLRVTDCIVDQMQIKLDTWNTTYSEAGPTLIARNYLSRCRNLAVSAVAVVTDGSFGDFVDLWIVDNVMQDLAGDGGIFVGSDGESALVRSLRRVHIVNNVIRGNWTNLGQIGAQFRQAVGIDIVAAQTVEQIEVSGNEFSKDGSSEVEVFGITFRNGGGPSTITDVSITDNTFERMDNIGISFGSAPSSTATRVNISGNTMATPRGLLVGAFAPLRDCIIASNVLTGGPLTVSVVRTGDSAQNVLIRDNIVRGVTNGDGILISAVTGTTISADVQGNRSTANLTGVRESGVVKSFDTRYVDNDFRGNQTAAALVSAGYRRDNLGYTTESPVDFLSPAKFRRSGVVTITSANQALTGIVPGGLDASSHVLATMQTNSGTLTVRAAVPIVTGANANKIQIFLTGTAPSSGVKVAWFVL